jgi:alanine dehydrogenase
VLLLRDDHIRAAMAQADIIDDLEKILARPAGSGLELPRRLTVDAADGQGFLRLMPVISYQAGYAGYKAMNYHPIHGVRYLVALTSLQTGCLEALLDADWITAQRTAATAAIAVRKLAPEDAERVLVIGSGTQARALLESAARVLTPARIEVFSPTEANRSRFASTMADRLQLEVEAVDDLDAALHRADVVLSAFRANTKPIIHADAVKEGALVCGISSVRPHHREVDASLWKASRVVVDDKEHVCESGDGNAAGLTVDDPTTRELWEVLQNPGLGRASRNERVLFKSVGTAEQDIALSAIVLQQARAAGFGEDLGEFPALRPIQSPSPAAAQAWEAGR